MSGCRAPWHPRPLLRATDAEGNIGTYAWRKVLGPDAHTIESPAAPVTRVANLEMGTYEFELTVTDLGGLIGTDTVSIHVYEPRVAGANELVFRNLRWGCPLGCTASVEGPDVPTTGAIRVFVGQADAASWVEAVPENQSATGTRYLYSLRDSRLTVYADAADGLVDVKVIF